MAEDFIKTFFGGKKRISGLSLYYLTNHMDEYVPLQDLADFCQCTPRKVINALKPYLLHSLMGRYLEEKRIDEETGTKCSQLFYIKSDDRPDSWPSVLKKLFEIAESFEK